jgi:hypothetical protein
MARSSYLIEMKRSRFLFSTISAAALTGLAFTGCEKKPADQPKSPEPAQSQSASGTAATSGSAPAAAPAPKPAPAAAAADVAKIASAYGFVARLPKDVEGFGANYRLHDLWTGLANSKWAATFLDLPPVKQNPDFTRMREQWNSEQGQQARTALQSFFGKEVVVAMPAGFTSKLQPWIEFATIYQETVLQAYFMMGMTGGTPTPDKLQQMLKDSAPQFVPILSKLEIPPFLFAFKASDSKALIDGATKQLMQMVGSELPPAFTPGQFKVGEKYDFQSISVDAKKLVAAFQEEQIKLQLKELLGDEAKATEALNAIVAKRIELAWGWVDDYLVVSVGTNHDHLKLATSEGDSALAIGEVAARGAQFAAQKPLGLGYVSKATFEAMEGNLEFAEQFKSFANELQGILKPEQIDAMVADVRRLEAKAQALYKTNYSPAVQVDLWDGGLRTEIFGGGQHKAFDSSKPLLFGSLATPSTLLMLDGRSNAAYSKATADLIEDAAATIWGWYEKYGRTMVPESERQGAAMIEATAKPMLVDFWRHSRKLSQAFGEESALILDLNGAVPKIPDLPPFLANGRVPRLAWVTELKDRAAASEAWKGYHSLIKQIAALADQGPGVPEPEMKKEGDTELHFVPLPMPTDDFLPHVAISKDRWMISTSPSFTKEIVAKSATPGATPVGSHWNVNFNALYDLADVWLKIFDGEGSQLMSPTDAEQYKAARPMIDIALKLARSVQGFEWHLHEESGVPRSSLRLKLQDLK